MKILGLDHMVITTNDMEACLRFYVDDLSLELHRPNGRYSVAFGQQKINLHQLPNDITPVAEHIAVGSMNYCLVAQGDPEKILRHLQERKVDIVEPKIYRRHGALGDFDSFYVRDPDENLVEISVYEPAAEPFKITGIDHMVIVTGTFEETMRFYTEYLGMRPEVNGPQRSVCFGRQKFNIHADKPLYEPAEKNAAFGSCDFCLIVEGDIYRIKEELEEKGVVIELGVVRRSGALGPVDSVYLRDPDGNLVELSVYPAVIGPRGSKADTRPDQDGLAIR